MRHLYNALYLKSRRRALRRKQTAAESLLWSQLRGKRLHGHKFFRQFSVGNYILDFYSTHARLAVELDGPYHFFGRAPAYDAARTAYLNQQGIRVIRFRNEEVFENPDKVLAEILAPVEGGLTNQ